MENRQKVIDKITELDNEWTEAHPPSVDRSGSFGGLISVLPRVPVAEPTHVWQEFPGYHALTKFDYNNGAPIFDPVRGVPVKAFLNSRTGEIRVFLASIFEI